MDKDELVGELLQDLIDEVKTLQLKLDKLPTETPPDYRASIDELTKAVQGLQNQSKQTPLPLIWVRSPADSTGLNSGTDSPPSVRWANTYRWGLMGLG